MNVTAVNDPPETPNIVDPINELTVWEDQGLLLYAMCDDPDLPYGDRLNFTWSVNSTAGEWYGDQVVEPQLPPGAHIITVNVTDEAGEASQVSVRVHIRSIPPEDKDDESGVTQEGRRDMTWVFYLTIVSLAIIVLWVALVHRWYGKKAEEHMDGTEGAKSDGKRAGGRGPGSPAKGGGGTTGPAPTEGDPPDEAAPHEAGEKEPAEGEDTQPGGGDGPDPDGEPSLCGDDWDLDEEMRRNGECADDGAGPDGGVSK